MKMIRTIVCSKAYFYFMTFEEEKKAYRHVCAHEPLLSRCFDVVAMGECQPLSRTVSHFQGIIWKEIFQDFRTFLIAKISKVHIFV